MHNPTSYYFDIRLKFLLKNFISSTSSGPNALPNVQDGSGNPELASLAMQQTHSY